MKKANKLTQNEVEIFVEQVLKTLTRRGKFIELQLHPPSGMKYLKPYGNTIYINEGRDGRFEDISDAFYMEMVYKYDSVCKRK